jgi:DNA (cytosine-5)-methyltransferase 1
MYTQNSKNNNLSPTLDTRYDCLGVCVRIKNNTKKGYLEAYPGDGIYTNTSTKRGTVQSQSIQTITTFQDKGVVLEDLRIRKLTPKECWRLMGFSDSDYEKASKCNSNAQLYKQAGNSIVVNVLEAILRNLLLNENAQSGEKQLTIFDLK